MNSLTIAWNMVKRTIGTRKGFLLQIVLPSIVVAVLAGFVGGGSDSKFTIAYVNHEQDGIASKLLIKQLAEIENYDMREFQTEADMKDNLLRFKAGLGMSIPDNFTEALFAGQKPLTPVYEMVTSQDSYMARVKLDENIGMLHSIAAQSSISTAGSDKEKSFTKLVEQAGQAMITIQKLDLQLYPKEGLSLVTGFTLMFLMGLVSNTVLHIAQDRSQRTLARIYTAPVTSFQITVGNFLGSLCVGLLQIIIIVLVSRYVMGYEYGVALMPHILILGVFMLVTMGIASTVAGFIRNPQNIGMLNNLIIFPTCMLGGCFWPITFMPDFMQRIANFVPQKWAIQAVEALSAGDSLDSIVIPLSILGLMALILLTVGSAVLRPQDRSRSM